MHLSQFFAMKKYYESIRTAHLLAKFASKSITENEKKELGSLIKQTGINAEEILKAAADTNSGFLEADTEASKRVWNSVQIEIARSKREFTGKLLRYAAIFLIAISISLTIYYIKSQENTQVETIFLLANETVLEYPTGEQIVLADNTDISSLLSESETLKSQREQKEPAEMYKIKVSSGSTHTVTFEDGTTVTLYPESELLFPSYFSSQERAVTLTGEGYFDVKPDSSRLFRVDIGYTSVVVYGTSFNIRAYRNEPTIEAALVRGKITMNQKELLPNQMAVMDKENLRMVIESIDASIYQDRANGMFIFENRGLDEIMKEFGLWFGFEYTFKDEIMKDKKFRFRLPRTSNFNYLMNLMEKTGEVKFEVSDKKVIIMATKD